MRRKSCCEELTIVSANLRGFYTNLGELTHVFVRAHNADKVFVSETFLDNCIPKNYVRIKEYSAGGGVTLCYKSSLSVVVPDTPILAGLEVISV